jgi:hypothetical protein
MNPPLAGVFPRAVTKWKQEQHNTIHFRRHQFINFVTGSLSKE